MPESTPLKLPMADDNPRSRLGAGKKSLFPRWLCPGEQTLAAYVDNALGQRKTIRISAHLANCERCRGIVADVVKLQRTADLPMPPPGVGRIPVRTAPRWFWAPAAALAALVLIISIGVLRQPRDLLVLPQRTPSAPMVAKVESANPPSTPAPGIVRGRPLPEVWPVLLAPLEGSTVARRRLAFDWKPVAHSRYYEIRLVTSDGDLRWQARTTQSALSLPANVALPSGPYFVWITAYRADGRVSKSPPVRFLVEP